MAKLQLIVPKKRSDGPGCKVYNTKDKKFVVGIPQEVTAAEKKYLLATELFEEVKEVPKEEPKTDEKEKPDAK